MKINFGNIILIIAVFIATQTGFSQLSKTHYIPPLTAADHNSSIPGDQYMYISTPSNADVAFTIKKVGLSSAFDITGVVSNNNPKQIQLATDGFGQLFVDPVNTSQVFNSRGYIVEATDLIYVSIRMNSSNDAQAGALVSKGASALGTEFRVGAFTNQAGRTTNNNGSTSENLLSFVSVMATEDNTNVTFSNISNNTEIINNTKTFPYSETLQKGDCYTIAMNSYSSTFTANNKDGLIGALVKSDKPIVVNCGSANGSFHNGTGRDYGIDQIVGASKIGDQYIFVKGDGQIGWENVLIVPHTNGTTISINGNTPFTITGKYHLIEGDQYSPDGNMYVKTSNPVFAYQGVGATNGEANQGMFFVPPLSCETKGNVDNIANIDAIGSTAYSGGVSIVTKKGATVTINNLPLTAFTTQGPFNVTGNTEYETYKVTGLTGPTTSVQCDSELYCAYFNFSGAATSGSFYSGFPTAPEINFNADFVTLGNCIDNITLEAANMGSFESVEWYYDDGSGGGFIATGNKTQIFTPTFPNLSPFSTGTYKLIGITCTGEKIESDEVPVGICPDDTDNDGIIDNLDIDNDNDGILNCTESYGNYNINLSNTSSGSLPVGGFSYTGNVNLIGGGSNNITGDTNGVITSSVASKNGLSESSIAYELNFNKNLNLLFQSNSTLTDQDEFIIQVTNNKTITLVDPDDQLLIDTNYDGVYESGITQFSSFVIHFKIKGTSLVNGTSTFKFVSSMIANFSYKHINISETTSSNADFKITATCVPLDTDLDGINDDFDYDSDNDGVPDIIEGTGTLKVLSGSDSNNDGLDDVFDINTFPIDTDLDGIPDYLDLDSDNDGIFDIEESGSGLPDSDLNGVIDHILTIGLNGWDDTVETSPDSGVINYTITNTDADLLFNYIDSDSDGDNCTDVIEAGFSDGNSNNFLGDSTVNVNTSGKVTNAFDGYTSPNSAYITAGLITITQQPIDTKICALKTTKITIETNVIDSYQWQLSTDGVNWNDINDDLIYSNTSTNELTIATTPLSYNNNKYRVVLTKNGNTCGLISDEITLSVNALPIANLVSDIENCDDLTDGDDTNGIVQNFDLESRTNDILGTQLPIDYLVTYHLSQTDADTKTGALVSPYTNITNPQTIYTRVENITTGCFVSNITFNLIVDPLPIANAVSDLIECDNLNDNDDTNGVVQNFNLDSQTNTILGTQLPSEFTVTYHLSNAEAISGANPLTSPHENSLSPNSQTIFVRIENNLTGCVNSHLNFNVVVNALPIANVVQNIELCDNLDDGNDTNGIVETWDLESQTSLILGTQPPSAYNITYHLSNAEAISGANPLTSPHSNNSSPNNQTIFVRVLNIATRCINTQISFDLIVHPLPTITSTVELKQCDNDTDGFSFFNLTEANNKISVNATNEIFTYYLSEADALAQSNPITNYTSFENNTVNSDIVWASIASQFGCRREAQIQLFVSTTGIPSTYHKDFYQCDDYVDVNNNNRDGITTFNFSEVDNEIRAIFPSGQQIFITYYRNEEDALAEKNAITDISNYRNIGSPFSQNIYVRVDSEINNDCLGFGDHITLNVEALPIANAVTIKRQCDDDADGMFPFDISTIESTVLNGQTNVTVTYIDEGGNLLPSPLPNPFLTNSQTITIRVTNNSSLSPDGPCYDETTLEFIVDKSPIVYPVTVPPACDDDSNDGIYGFDTSSIQSTILGNQAGMEVHYYDELSNELPSPLPNPFTIATQTISVEVINPLNTTCVASSTIDFIVNPLPDFEVETPRTICITDSAPMITLIVDQDDPQEILDYEWTNNPNGSILSTNKLYTVSNPGTYYVTLTKTDGTLCSRTREIVVDPSANATITLNDIIVKDDTDNNTITILTDNLGIGTYEFAIDEPFSYQYEPFFDYVEAGIHTIYVNDTNGCGPPTSLNVSVIGFPKFITPNNDGSNDYWNVTGLDSNNYPIAKIYIFDRFGKLITIITPDSEGWDGNFNGQQLPASDYWFSVELIDSDGNIRIRKGHFSLIR